MNNNNKPLPDVGYWIFTVIALFAFWPLGLFLMIRKILSYFKGGEQQSGSAGKSGFTSDSSAFRRQTNNAGNQSGAGSGVRQSSSSAPKKETGKKRSNVTPLSVLLLILGIVLLIAGGGTLFSGIEDLTYFGFDTHVGWTVLRGAVYCLGGAGALLSRFFLQRRANRYAKYAVLIGTRKIVPISDISSASGYSEKKVKKDLQKMIEAGMFGGEAYIDVGLGSFVVSAAAAEEERQTRYNAERQKAAENAPPNKYAKILKELRDVNETIIDGPISEKIYRIEDTTAKIFRAVEDEPDKLRRINKFMDYYLPTTLKLLHAYSTLERQGIEGENITAAKQDIGRILDTLAQGFDRQLDQLFKDDVMDISSDIDVLETMMRQDGLSSDGTPFGGTMAQQAPEEK